VKKKLVTGLFKNRAEVEKAFDRVRERGYTQDDVSLLMSTATKTKEFGIEESSKAAAGAGVGGAVGGTIGATIAAIAAIGTTVTMPPLGLVIAGPLAAALAGAGAGAATGGLVGALVGAGIPEYRAKVYDEGVREGGIVLGVEARTDEDAGRLEKIFENVGARHFRQD
jgi:hypothetical protein